MPNVVDSVKWIQDHAPNKMVTARTPQPGGWLYNKHSQHHHICDDLTVVIRFFQESLSFSQFPP